MKALSPTTNWCLGCGYSDWEGFQSDWLTLCPLQGGELVQLAVDLNVPETQINALAVEEILGLERLSVCLAISLPPTVQRVS